MSLLEDFLSADRKYEAARLAWAQHVDQCETCKRSIFACEVVGPLNDHWHAAWNAARRIWLRLTEEQREAIRASQTDPH